MEAKILGPSSNELEKIREEVGYQIGKISEEIAEACKDGSADKAGFLLQRAMLIGKLGKLVADLTVSSKQSDKLGFVMGSLFLHDSFDFLNARRVESLHFVTGPQLGNTAVLDRIVDLELEIQTLAFAKGNSRSIRMALIKLGAYEHKLQGCFHIHPGVGTGSTMPSSVDLRLQETLDRGGYEVLGAIFSRDGFLRFYSSVDFEIQVYGKGVEQIDGKLYRLTKIS